MRTSTRRRFTAPALAAVLGILLVPGIPLSSQDQGDRPAATTANRSRPPTSPVTGSAESGRQLYHDYLCYGCHGYTGETGTRPFVGNWTMNLSTEARFVRFLRGRATVSPELPSTRMPSYAETTLSDAQAKDIYAFIRTFRSHAPPLDQIEVMRQILSAAER